MTHCLASLSSSKPFSAFVPLAAALTLAGCASNAPLTPAAAPAAQSAPSPQAAKPAKPAPAATPATAPAHWDGVQALVGKYPSDGVDFLRTGPIAERLKGLLGPVNYPVFVKNMGVSGPLRKEGQLIYIIGNRQHQGRDELAAMVLDPGRDAMRAWLKTGDEEWDVQDAGPAVQLPAEVRQFIQNAHEN